MSVTYDPNSNGVSIFNITTDVVHAPTAPNAKAVGPQMPPPEVQDVLVAVALPTNNNSAVVYVLMRGQTTCVDTTHHGNDTAITTPGDDLTDGSQTDKSVANPGCFVYWVTAKSNSDAGAATKDSPLSNQVTIPSNDTTAPTIKDAHVTDDVNGVADSGDTQSFKFSETMDAGIAANGMTYRLQDGDGTQVDIVCGTNATCTLDNNGFDPGPPPSGFGTLTVKLTGAPTAVTPGSSAGLQYGTSGATIVSVDSHWKDQAGNALDLANSDRLIERQTT